MMRLALFTTLCVSLLVAENSVADKTEIKHLRLDEAQLIWTGDDSYAITHPGLFKYNWKSVTIAGNQATIVTPECDTRTKPLSALTEEQRNSLELAKTELEGINDAANVQKFAGDARYCSTIWRIDRDSYEIKRCKNLEVSTADHDEMLMQRHTDHHFTGGKSFAGDGVARIFFNEDVVTSVKRSGSVIMKPANCLHIVEKSMLFEIRRLFNQAQMNGTVKEEVLTIHERPKRLNIGQLGKKLIEGVQSVCRLAEIKIKQLKGPPRD